MDIALCDDNILFLKEIEKNLNELLDSYNIKHHIFSFMSGEAIINAIEKNSFDIIFLDIDMPNLNGKDVAIELRKLSHNRFKLVFVSDYYEEVFYTFQYDIESFIPKNRINEFLPNELKRIVDIISNQEKERQSFSFKYSQDKRNYDGCVFLDEILFIESLNGDIILHTLSHEYRLVNYKFERIKNNSANMVS